METHLLKRMAHALMSNQARVGDDPHRPHWHLSPNVGLLNDPNGFIHHNGRYHLFYQWNPLACAHGAKFWGHWSSPDLVSWRHEPVALVPSESYETHGCYSGSAVVDNGAITLIYTGNVKYADGSRSAFQCLARENADGEYDKLGPVLTLPEGYTGHVRDPKVWKHDGRWYMVLGAQDKQLRVRCYCIAPAICAAGIKFPKSPVRALADWGFRLHVGMPGFIQAERTGCLNLLPAGRTRARRALSEHLPGRLPGRDAELSKRRLSAPWIQRTGSWL